MNLSTKGRLSRSQFLPYFIISLAINTLGYFIGTSNIKSDALLLLCFGFILEILGVIIFIPAAIRRLHDTNNSGWLILVLIIPIGGLALFLYLLFANSVYENNLYVKDSLPNNLNPEPPLGDPAALLPSVSAQSQPMQQFQPAQVMQQPVQSIQQPTQTPVSQPPI